MTCASEASRRAPARAARVRVRSRRCRGPRTFVRRRAPRPWPSHALRRRRRRQRSGCHPPNSTWWGGRPARRRRGSGSGSFPKISTLARAVGARGGRREGGQSARRQMWCARHLGLAHGRPYSRSKLALTVQPSVRALGIWSFPKLQPLNRHVRPPGSPGLSAPGRSAKVYA